MVKRGWGPTNLERPGLRLLRLARVPARPACPSYGAAFKLRLPGTSPPLATRDPPGPAGGPLF